MSPLAHAGRTSSLVAAKFATNSIDNVAASTLSKAEMSAIMGAGTEGSVSTTGWVKRSVFNSLDNAIKKKIQAAIKNGIVAPVGKQGIIKLTRSEAVQTGFSHKIKILGKGGDLRIYGNQGKNGPR